MARHARKTPPVAWSMLPEVGLDDVLQKAAPVMFSKQSNEAAEALQQVNVEGYIVAVNKPWMCSVPPRVSCFWPLGERDGGGLPATTLSLKDKIGEHQTKNTKKNQNGHPYPTHALVLRRRSFQMP